MNERQLRALLRGVKAGRVGEAEALRALQHMPFEDLGFARVDHHRSLRCGHVEVIFGQGKTPAQALSIATSLVKRAAGPVLVTRADEALRAALVAGLPGAVEHAEARAVTIGRLPRPKGARIAVVSAGTADCPVAQEAVLTARVLGAHVDVVEDVGVAGLHRLLAVLPSLRQARALVVVAGMEGALPSVVAGLVSSPVIAVPTSVGYGASFGGIAALLSMLNTCASGVSVVNIDNGFGAGFQAALIAKPDLAGPKG